LICNINKEIIRKQADLDLSETSLEEFLQSSCQKGVIHRVEAHILQRKIFNPGFRLSVWFQNLNQTFISASADGGPWSPKTSDIIMTLWHYDTMTLWNHLKSYSDVDQMTWL
jgi:hypothetical protein